MYDLAFVIREMGGNENHLKGRERARMKVRIRDAFRCQDCKKVRTLREVETHNKKIVGLKGKLKLFDVHHIDGQCGKNSRGYDAVGDIDKLITLCHSCHYRHHLFSKRAEGVWQEVYTPPEPLYQWGLTKEELQVKAPYGLNHGL